MALTFHFLFSTRLRRDSRGAAVVEFALLAPLFGMLLFGIMGYGQYFLIAHSVQQLANDAARATIAGLSSSERATIARATVSNEANGLTGMTVARLSTATSEDAGTITVRVRYDASNIGLLRTGLVPMPDAMIERRAVVRLGGIS